ncbi:delta-aminolevulinic acid dehydratase [Actinomadura sp. NBRC 104425]|nr:delta-aminolevulinic acid dehydratase [Actinomadura sp. NBRC 104425]
MVRDLTDSLRIRPPDLVLVLLVGDGTGARRMPTVTLPDLPTTVRQAAAVGIRAVKLFASSSTRDARGTAGQDPGCLMVQAIRAVKDQHPDMAVMTETCLCSYTDSGECHLSHPDGSVDLPATADALVAQAVTQAAAGADIVGPAAMAAGSVRACRQALDGAGYGRVRMMTHLILASGLYDVYRMTMNAAPASGGRLLQISPDRAGRAVSMGLRMLQEGAGSLLLEPALFCTDILIALRARTAAPLLPFSVSGEYLSLAPDVLAEEYTMLRRAGATQIITYAATDLAASWSIPSSGVADSTRPRTASL